jgi:hypothetical protein
MKNNNQSEIMREHIVALRHQIVSLKDSQMVAVINRDHTLEELLGLQIELLTERLKAQLDITELVNQNQPQKRGWFSGHIKSKEDRLSAIMD